MHKLLILFAVCFAWSALFERTAHAQAIASPESVPPKHRAWIPYGGVGMGLELTPRGGSWFGGSTSFAMRYRQILELRVDGSVSVLTPSIHTKDTCGTPPCLIGLRGVLTHSLGPRIVLGGSRSERVAITPSFGWSLGAQAVQRTDRTPAFDSRSPKGWQAFTPGVTVAYGMFEGRALVRLPRGAMDQPTIDLAFGFMF